MDWFDGILYPLMVAVAWIMVRAHDLLTFLGLDPAGGLTWALSIVALVVVIRILLIPLFVRQIKASRGMQMVQPEIQKLQKKYKGKTDPASRQAMQQEMMAIYKEAGTSPFASCLPILAQMPIFFALFRVLISLEPLANGTYAGGTKDSIGPLTQQLAAQAEASTIFGAQLSDTFLTSDSLNVKIVCAVLVVIMSATTLFTQRQLTMKNMPQSALDNPMARQQRILMYILPLVFAFSGVNFPIGVLIYWSTTNIWSMGQQWWVIRNNPTPGSEAERIYKERLARKAAHKSGGSALEDGGAASGGVAVLEDDAKPGAGQRQQPKKGAPRAKRATRPPGGQLASNPVPNDALEDAPVDAPPEDAGAATGALEDAPPSATTSPNTPKKKRKK